MPVIAATAPPIDGPLTAPPMDGPITAPSIDGPLTASSPPVVPPLYMVLSGSPVRGLPVASAVKTQSGLLVTRGI